MYAVLLLATVAVASLMPDRAAAAPFTDAEEAAAAAVAPLVERFDIEPFSCFSAE